MPKHYSYSADLRCRAVWLVLLRKMSYNEAGDILFMSEQSVRRYVDQYQSTGDVEPRKHRHGPKKMLNEAEIIGVAVAFGLVRPGPVVHMKIARMRMRGFRLIHGGVVNQSPNHQCRRCGPNVFNNYSMIR